MDVDPTGLGKTVPEIYKDLAGPAMREVGDVARRTVRAMLAPARGALWSFERAEEYVEKKVTERLAGIPEEKLQSPPPEVLVPVFQGIIFVGHEELREMFASLLATSMIKEMAGRAHPAFADAIRQMAPDEARIIRHVEVFGVSEMPVMVTERKIRVLGPDNQSSERGGQPLITQASWPAALNLKSNSPVSGASYLANLTRLGLVMTDFSPIASTVSGLETTDGRGDDGTDVYYNFSNVKTTVHVSPSAFGRQFLIACDVTTPDV